MDIWLRRAARAVDYWNLGQGAEILDAILPVGRGFLQSASDPGRWTDHTLVGKQRA